MTETHDYQPATGSQVTLPGAAPRAAFIGQSTTIEQSRAVAEVEALVVVAQRRPRNEEAALARILRSTKIKTFASKAFYEYPRGKTTVRDLNIGAAKEMARCWWNMQFAVVELSQDLANNQSEMLAWAWDMEANFRVERRKIVPHVRDSKEYGRKTITDFREIGEILGNWAARQLRECIKDVLPQWYIDAARDGFNETIVSEIAHQPIEVVRVKAISSFQDDFEVSHEQLQIFLNRASGKWSMHDVARLRTLHSAIKRGDTRVEDVFEPETLKPVDVEQAPASGDVAAAIAGKIVKPPAPVVEPEQPQTADAATALLLVQIVDQMRALDVLDRQDVMNTAAQLTGRDKAPDLLDELTHAEAVALNNRLADILKDEHPGHALDAVLDAISNGDEIVQPATDNPTGEEGVST